MKGKLPNTTESRVLTPALPSLVTLPRKRLHPRRAHFTMKINGQEGSSLGNEQSFCRWTKVTQAVAEPWLSPHQAQGIFRISAHDGKGFKFSPPCVCV